MKRLRQDNSGFTLVELIVATAILAVIMAPLMRSFVVAMQTNQLANSYGSTTSAIGNVIETVKDANVSTMAQDLEGDYGTLLNVVDYVPDSPTFNEGTPFYYSSGDQTVKVEWNKPTSADYAILESMNVTDLAAYTNIDLTMIQTGGSVDMANPDTGVMESVINDPDLAAYASLKNQLGRFSGNNLFFPNAGSDYTESNSYFELVKRVINVNMTAKNYYVDASGNPALSSTPGAIKKDSISYVVEYEYNLDFYVGENTGDSDDIVPVTEKYTVFQGTIYPGSDDIFAMQLVYIPMNHNMNGRAEDPETININFELENTGSGSTIDTTFNSSVRFFVIKQMRATHSFGCDSGSFNIEDKVSGTHTCDDCSSEDYETDYFTTHLNIADSTSATYPMAVYTNIANSVYSGADIQDTSRNKFTLSGVTDSSGVPMTHITDLYKLFNVSDGRIYIVDVEVYDVDSSVSFSEASLTASKLLSSMSTVKLN